MMQYIDLTSPDPGWNLTLDESLLEICEMGGSEVLRVWESASYFIVMGLSGREEREVHLVACRRDGIPILRRKTGGGTVLQGPGCLNYTLVLRKDRDPALSRIDTTHAYCLDRLAQRLRSMQPAIRRDGISDLTLEGKKFSGNAQRRLRRAILYHGTLLYDFDRERVERYLKEPERQPDYRMHRSHRTFLRNLEISPESLKKILLQEWNGSGNLYFTLSTNGYYEFWPGGWDIPGATVGSPSEQGKRRRRTARASEGRMPKRAASGRDVPTSRPP